MKTKKCILLVRVSTESQSFEEQEKELYELALKDGYSKEQIESIPIKESGFKTEEERLGLQRMYNCISTGEFDCVYAWEISRIARTKKVLFSVQEKLVRNHMQLIIKNPSLRLLKDNGKIDEGAEMIFTLFAQLAEAEMRNKKDRFTRGKRAKAREGKWVGEKLPYGYDVDYDNDNTIIIHKENAEIVKAVYNLYEKGFSQTKIPMELEKRGFNYIPSIGLVSHILKYEGYTGKESEEKKMKGWAGRGDWTKFPRRYPPIISIEQYERCRKIAKENSTKLNSKTSNIYYASNLIFCPDCGSKWVGNAHDTSYRCYISHLPERVYKYGCYQKLGDQCKNKTNISINILDSLLWQIALQEEFNCRFDDNDTEISQISDEITEKSKMLVRLDELIENITKKKDKLALLNVDGRLSDKAFEYKLSELDKEKANYDQEYVSIKSAISQLEMKQIRLESKSKKSSAFKRLKDVLSDEDYKMACDIMDLSKSIKEEIEELKSSANDIVRNDLIHEHIEKIYVEPVSFIYLHKTERLRGKKVDGKLIRIYTYSQELKRLKDEEPSQYPYYYISVSNDGFGGKTLFKFMKNDFEFSSFDKANIDLYSGDFLQVTTFEKMDRFLCERKIEMRKKEKEERKKLHSSIEYLLEKDEEKRRKKEERKRKAREYAKKKYWENKKKGL